MSISEVHTATSSFAPVVGMQQLVCDVDLVGFGMFFLMISRET